MNDLERPGCLLLTGIAALIILIFALAYHKSPPKDDKAAADSMVINTDTFPKIDTTPTPTVPPTPPRPSASVPSHYDTPDDAYYDGYEEGYDQGLEDGTNGQNHSYGYDETNDYSGDYDIRYRQGYEDGYEDGYSEGRFSYEERE